MSIESLNNGNLQLYKLMFADGTSQTTANTGSSILDTNNQFNGTNQFLNSVTFSNATTFDYTSMFNNVSTFKGNIVGTTGCSISGFANIDGGVFNADLSTDTFNITAPTTITTQLTVPSIYYGSNALPQTTPYLGSTTKPYTVSADTSTTQGSPTSLTGYTTLVVNSSYALQGNVYLSLPATYKQEKFIFLNRNVTAHNVYITINAAGDRISYYNTDLLEINQVSLTTEFLVFPQQDPISPIGFAYVFEAIENEGMEWIVSAIPLASLNMQSF